MEHVAVYHYASLPLLVIITDAALQASLFLLALITVIILQEQSFLKNHENVAASGRTHVCSSGVALGVARGRRR